MESASYRKVTTQRGFTYGYYYAPNPNKGRPTVLLLIGFPSTALDWSSQFQYLAEHDYGVIAPDMLGYGGTDSPVEAEAYKGKDMTQDIVDIVTKEGIDKAVAISHDWGVLIGSRLVNYHQDRLLASAFVSVGYCQPYPQFDWEKTVQVLNQAIGYDVIGYWDLFTATDAASLIEKNLDSFYSLVFPADPALWKTDLSPRGKARQWVENNKQGDLPFYWSEEDKRKHQARLMRGGLQGPLNWYVARAKGLDKADDESVPEENFKCRTPTLFVATLKDYASPPFLHEPVLRKYCDSDNLTIKEIDASHWVMLEKPDELNKVLEEFLSKL